MRADRLVATLLLLQARGQVTAAEVATELEVSERTARRDLDALGMAGIPVYSVQGRNGGWRLAGGGRTDLSGLSAAEARALFLVAGPASAATPEVRAALRKLTRALPEPLRPEAEAASAAIVVDGARWGRTGGERPPPEHLDALQHAVIDGEQIELGYVAGNGASSTRIVHPLGLAAKGEVWYLVADTDAGMRTFRVDRVTATRRTGDAVVRPDGFDLGEAWRLVTEGIDEHWTARARGLAVPDIVPVLRMVFGRRVRIGPTIADGRVEVEFGGWAVRGLAGSLAGFGANVEVIGPDDVVAALAQIALELASLYPPPR